MKRILLVLFLFSIPLPSILIDNVLAKEGKYEYALQADFSKSYEKIRSWEGNYVNNPLDKGGITYGGITKKHNPKWNGWNHIKGTPKWNELIPQAEFWVKDYYLTIWVREGFYNIRNQELANILFDLRIHISKRNTIKIINKSLSKRNIKPINKNEQEWALHLSNILIANNYSSNAFIKDLTYTRIEYYYDLVRKDSTQQIFINGWLRRAKSIDV
jgi:lysozyme family protein